MTDMRARSGVRRVLPVLVLLSLGAGPVAGDQQATFRSGIDLIAVDVSARIGREPILGLQAADFEVLDNGIPQDIVDVSYGSLPIDITLAIDLSFKSSKYAASLRAAVSDQVARLEKQDRVRLILFNSRVPRATEFTSDAAVIDRALREARAGSQSGFADVFGDALAAATPTDRRHLVLFVTDGGISSSAKPEMLLDLARRSRSTLSMILPIEFPTGRGQFVPSAGQKQRTDSLNQLAQETGGIIVWQTPNADVGPVMRTLFDDFRASYVLHFAPRGVDPGGVHTLQVRVKRPDARVKARRAYVR
jgi:VWFA-related protein